MQDRKAMLLISRLFIKWRHFERKTKALSCGEGDHALVLYILFFLQKVFGGHLSFFGATGTLVLVFWWRLLWVSKPEWVLLYLYCGGECNVHSLRSTSGATYANLLTAGLLPVLSPHTVAEVRLLGFELVLSEYLWVRRSTNWANPGRARYVYCFIII